MKIDLNRQEVARILREKFGHAEFRVFYTESDQSWEARNDRKISEMAEPPSKDVHVLVFDEPNEPVIGGTWQGGGLKYKDGCLVQNNIGMGHTYLSGCEMHGKSISPTSPTPKII